LAGENRVPSRKFITVTGMRRYRSHAFLVVSRSFPASSGRRLTFSRLNRFMNG
jgi:hypothetical protein